MQTLTFCAFHVRFMFFHNSCEATHRTLAVTIEKASGRDVELNHTLIGGEEKLE